MYFNESIEEKKYRLKYFYFIDSESIIARIMKTNAYQDFDETKPNSIQWLLGTIFSEIMTANKLFSDYILSCNNPMHLTFFDENPRNDEVLALNTLSSVVLFHHCILAKFYGLQGTEKSIKLNGRDEYRVRTGLIQPCKLNTDELPSPWREAWDRSNSENINQDNYSRNQNLEKPKKKNYYSSFLLDLIAPKNEKERRTSCPHNALFAFFLWMDPSVNTFSKYLSQPDKSSMGLIKNYLKLLNASQEWCYPSACLDRILFDIHSESFYGFSFMVYAADLLMEMNNCSNPSFSLKDLEGQGFINILAYFLDLPITYNRSIFLKYALKAILATDNLNPSFPSNFQDSAGKYMSVTQKSKVIMASESLRLLSDYLHMLSLVTLPMVEDLWFVLTAALIKEEKELSCLSSYIKEHFSAMISDYTLLKSNTLSMLTKQDSSFTIICNKLYSKLNSPLQKSVKVLTPCYPASTNDNLKYLIYYLCNKEHQQQHYKNLEFSFIDKFVFSSPASTQKLPYDVEENNLSSHRSAYDVERKTFFENHVKNIFNFAKTDVSFF